MPPVQPSSPRVSQARLTRRVSLRQLEVFAAAARQPNFSHVAEALHLSQPAVSMQIRHVEKAAGLPLFDKIGRQKVLTEAGRLLLRHVSRMLGELADAERNLQAMQGLAGGSVSVGMVSTAKYFAPRLLGRFSRSYPDIDVRFVAGNRLELVRLLHENYIDIAVMGRPPTEIDTIAEPLAPNPHVLAAAPDHPLRTAREMDLQELGHETFLIREPGSGTRLVMEEMFHDHLFRPERLVVLDSNETIKQSIMAGLGVSLLSLHTLTLELRTGGVALLDVLGLPVHRVWHVVQLRTRQLSPPAAAFRRFLIEETQAHLERACAGLAGVRRGPRGRRRQGPKRQAGTGRD